MPFRDAYTIVGRLVSYCIENDKTLAALTLEEFHGISPVFEDDVYQALDLTTCLNGRCVPGGPAQPEVMRQIAQLRAFIAERE